jgi:hypothetical protein
MAPVSRRSFLAGLIAAPVIAAVASKAQAPAFLPLIEARDEWAEFPEHGLRVRYLRGAWYGGNAGGGKTERLRNLGTIRG